jgi:putative ABC transport system substrate-binding protein
MRRRELFTLFGDALIGLPRTLHAQQPERLRRVGVLMNLAADDSQGQAFIAAFLQGLKQLEVIE